MARPSSEQPQNVEEQYDSPQDPVDSVVYSELPRRLCKFLRSAHLKNRRKSVPSNLASEAPDDVNTPWDIKNIHQLGRWCEADPDQVMEMLDTLRHQRDMSIEALELLDKLPPDEVWKARYEEAAHTIKRQSKKLSNMEKA